MINIQMNAWILAAIVAGLVVLGFLIRMIWTAIRNSRKEHKDFLIRMEVLESRCRWMDAQFQELGREFHDLEEHVHTWLNYAEDE